jgi:hypothetical protein
MEKKAVKMEEILVKMEKVDKMEKILAILEKITVTIPSSHYYWCSKHFHLTIIFVALPYFKLIVKISFELLGSVNDLASE